MAGLRVLITNNSLASRAGTQLYARDVAMGLLRRGFRPALYSTELGEVARELRAAGIPVVDHPASLEEAPDVIHGQHHLETMTALLHFSGVPGVFFSHNAVAWQDVAPRFPRIVRYVAVDELNRERLADEPGVTADRIRVVWNFVDMTRFRPRAPLPGKPRRALVFSNKASDGTFLGPVRKACAQAGLQLDVVGEGVGRPAARPEAILGTYDIVFAKGRCALEAMAVGAAVILCDVAGLGPMVTTGEFERLRCLNFGRRVLADPIGEDGLARAIARYDPRDAAEVSQIVRASADMEGALDQLITIYREAVEEARSARWDLPADDRAAADYLRRWGGLLQGRAELSRRKSELLRIHRSPLWRLRSRLLEVPGLAALYRVAVGSPRKPDE